VQARVVVWLEGGGGKYPDCVKPREAPLVKMEKLIGKNGKTNGSVIKDRKGPKKKSAKQEG